MQKKIFTHIIDLQQVNLIKKLFAKKRILEEGILLSCGTI